MFQWQHQAVRFIALWSILLSSIFISHTSSAASSTAYDQHQLVIGAISKNPQKHIKFGQPLADYLAANLADMGVNRGRVVVAEDLDRMGELLKTGQVDVVSDTLFTALQLQEKFGAEVLLKRRKKGGETYSSVIFVRQESGIKSLGDLRGKVVAFEDRHSTSGYFIPATLMLNQGYQLVELDSLRAAAPKDKIGYVFAKELLKRGNEISISSWVYRDVVDAGAFSSVNWNDPEDMPSELRTELNIIHQSAPFPRSIQLVRPGLAPQLKSKIEELLLSAHETVDGRKALKRYQKTSQFDALDDDTQEALEQALKMKAALDSPLQFGELAP